MLSHHRHARRLEENTEVQYVQIYCLRIYNTIYLQIYATTCMYGAGNVAREAARHAAAWQLVRGKSEAEFEGVPGGRYYRP